MQLDTPFSCTLVFMHNILNDVEVNLLFYNKLGEYNKICFVGSAVTRCCTNPKEEFEKRGLRKISETRMSVLENNVNATIYKNEEGTIMYYTYTITITVFNLILYVC